MPRTLSIVTARGITCATVCAIACATAAGAQTPSRRPSVHVLAGASIPTGAQRARFRAAPLGGFGVTRPVASHVRALGTLAWAAAQTKRALVSDGANAYEITAGAELYGAWPLVAGWSLEPFAGAGGGARVYDYVGDGPATTGGPTAYVAAGAELRLGRGAVRFEARQHAYRFRSPIPGEESATRGDASALLGVAYHFR